MLPYFGEYYGNPSSLHHLDARRKGVALGARADFDVLGCTASEIVITASGTRPTTWPCAGRVGAAPTRPRQSLRDVPNHLIVSAVEHKGVLETPTSCAIASASRSRTSVDSFGRVSPVDLAAAMRPDTSHC